MVLFAVDLHRRSILSLEIEFSKGFLWKWSQNRSQKKQVILIDFVRVREAVGGPEEPRE